MIRESGAATRPTLSVIVPVYNEEEVLPILFDRLTSVLGPLCEEYEIVCVNDGSSDHSAEALAAAHKRDPRIKTINFSRNFGKEAALTAGLDYATGDAVVPIDADLQDPPEVIGLFLEKWREGYDVVYGVRKERANDSWLKRTTAGWFYRVINIMTGTPIPSDAGDFRLMDRRVVLSIRRLREHNRFMKGLFAWVGFRHVAVAYDRPERAAGTTKFGYWRLWNFALDGITGFSTLPLRLAGYLGFFTATVAGIYGVYLIMRTLLLGANLPGYPSLMVAVLFLGGLQLMVLGVIGEYLGRVFEEAKRRPLYIVESAHGLEDHASNDLAAGVSALRVRR